MHCKRKSLQVEMKRGWLRKLADGKYVCTPLCKQGHLAAKQAEREAHT